MSKSISDLKLALASLLSAAQQDAATAPKDDAMLPLRQWEVNVKASVLKAEIQLAEQGGTHEFRTLVAKRGGAPVASRWFVGRFGPCFQMLDENGKPEKEYVSDKEAALTKAGLKVALVRKPAKVVVDAAGDGFERAAVLRVEIVEQTA
jgi:hypothetical protein